MTLLLEKGASINDRDRYKQTALQLAIIEKRFKIVELLLSKYSFKINSFQYIDQFPYLRNVREIINYKDHFTAYCVACLTHNETAIDNFVRLGISVRSCEKKNLWYKDKHQLHFAVKGQYLELVELLVKCGADITERNAKGSTPLHLAFSNYTRRRCPEKGTSEKIIDIILSAHSRETENCVDTNGISHFHVACASGDAKIVERFLERGVEINMVIPQDSDILGGYTPLHVAAHFNCTSIIGLLIKHGADVNALNNEKSTPLHILFSAFATDTSVGILCSEVVSRHDVGLFFSVSDEKHENCVDNNGVSHFHIACCVGNARVVEKLSNHGADVNAAISAKSSVLKGFTPLHCAVEYNNIDVVEFLLQRNANVNALNSRGLSPIHVAWFNKQKYFLTKTNDRIIDMLLLADNEDTEKYEFETRLTHFFIACTRSNPRVVENFLKRGEKTSNTIYSFKAKGLQGCNPLACAVMYNRLAIVKLLLQHKADVSITNERGCTALHLACELEYSKIYELIRDNVNEERECREINDDWVSNRRDHLAIIDLLLKRHSNVNHRDDFKQPLLFEAYEAFKFETVECAIGDFVDEGTLDRIKDLFTKEFFTRRNTICKVILDHKFRMDLQDSNRNTLLHVLASDVHKDNGIMEIAELCLSRGANINARNRNGATPLHVAVENGSHRRDLVEFFLKHKADVNCKKLPGAFTPLRLAYENFNTHPTQYRVIVDLLLSNGANVNASDARGVPLLCAACKVNEEVLTQALNYGADINMTDTGDLSVVDYLFIYNRSNVTTSSKGYRVFSIVRNHVQKLKEIGFSVEKKIESRCSRMEQKLYSAYANDNDEFLRRCRDELNRMKTTRAGHYRCSLFDIISKGPDKMAIYVKNDAFMSIVNSRNFDAEYPLYGYLLKLRVREGLEKEALLMPAKKVLAWMIEEPLPEPCYEHILQYFSNKDLKELLRIFR